MSEVEGCTKPCATKSCGRMGRIAMLRLLVRHGDDDLVAPMDDAAVKRGDKSLNGATWAHVRAAKRAAKAGDQDRAEKLARTIIQAWGVPDVDVPVVAEMRALVGE